MRNLWLLIFLIILLGGYGLMTNYWDQRRPSFQTELLEIDTAKVDLIQINFPGEEPEILLRRLEGRWVINMDNTNSLAKASAINKLLSGISQLQSKYLAEAQPDRWEVYELNEAKGTRLSIYTHDKLRESFILGAYHFNRQTEKSVTYLRLEGQNEVYAIDGAVLNKSDLNLQKLRNRRLLQLPPEADIRLVQYQTLDTVWQFRKLDNRWQVEPEQSFDTVALNDMLKRIATLQGDELAAEFDELQAATYFHHQIELQLEDQPEMNYTLTCYRDSTRKRPFVIHSSQFPTTWWQSDSSGLYAKITFPLPEFTPVVDPQ